MSDYTQVTDFSAKDALTSGDAAKKILGSDVDAELAAIATAITSKADDSAVVHDTGDETIAGTKTFSDAITVTGAVTAGSAAISGNETVGGTLGVTGKATFSAAILSAKGADIASGATVDLSTATGNYAVITHSSGTTAITSFGTVQAGTEFTLLFSVSGGTLSATHNATSNIIPGATDIASIPNGATARLLSLGSGNWRWLWYRAPQTLTDVAGSRSLATAYQNKTGQDISVGVRVSGSGDGSLQLTISLSPDNFSTTYVFAHIGEVVGVGLCGCSFTVPVGVYYKVAAVGTSAAINSWTECR